METHLPSPTSSLSPPSPFTSSSSSTSTTSISTTATKLSRTSSKRRKFNDEFKLTSSSITTSTNALSITSTSNQNGGINFTTPPPDSPHPNSLSHSHSQQVYQSTLQQLQVPSCQLPLPIYARRASVIALPNLSLDHHHQKNESTRNYLDSTTAGVEQFGLPSRVSASTRGKREMLSEKMERGTNIIIDRKNIVGTGGSGIPLRRSHDESSSSSSSSSSPSFSSCSSASASMMIIGRNSREVGNRDQFVQSLVGAAILAIESIWGSTSSSSESCSLPSPTSSPSSSSSSTTTNETSLPLRYFVTEVLRRSRTSCSTLQVALYYLHQSRKSIRDLVVKATTEKRNLSRSERRAEKGEREEGGEREVYPSPPLTPVEIGSLNFSSPPSSPSSRSSPLSSSQSNPLLCGRRTFLASLICASKFLQDRNFSNRAWAKISGLDVREINLNERAFLGIMRFDLFVGKEGFEVWTERLAALAIQTSHSHYHSATSASLPLPRQFPIPITPPASSSSPSSTTSTLSSIESINTVSGIFNFTASSNALALDLLPSSSSTPSSMEIDSTFPTSSMTRSIKKLPESRPTSSLIGLGLGVGIDLMACTGV